MTFGRRTSLELRVGGTHTVEVIVHLRHADLDWFGSSEASHRRQLFQLLGKKILPKECGDEMERYHEDKARSHRPPKIAGSVIVGEANRKTKAPSSKAGKKRKRSKTKQEETDKKELPSKSTDGKRRKDRHVFGETIQVTYRVEAIKPYESALVLYADQADSSGNNKKPNEKTSFTQLPKLSKRILMWCYPLDPNNPTEPNPVGGGFARPDLVPIASLFRPPTKEKS